MDTFCGLNFPLMVQNLEDEQNISINFIGFEVE